VFAQLRDRLQSIMHVSATTIAHPSKSRVRGMLESVRNAIADAYSELEDVVFHDLREFTAYEVGFQKNLVERRLGVQLEGPDKKRVLSIAERGRIGARKRGKELPPFAGQTVRCTLQAQEARCYRIVKRRIMLAIIAKRNETT